MGKLQYDQGLQQLSAHAFAYLQPDGGWGWSNSGLIAGKKESLLVDTLFDLKLTRRMLEEMQPKLEGPIRKLVNTHHNGDHCYGNELVPEADIIAHRACRDEMVKVPPGLLVQLLAADNIVGKYARECFGHFDFEGITLTPPTTVFDDRLTLYIDDLPIELIFLGPAHTAGDIIVHFPEEGVVYTGDLLFHLCTPLIWEGTCEQWLKALDAIMALNAEHIVPGHGPLADNAGVQTQKDYLGYLWDRAQELHTQGVPVQEAINKVHLGIYGEWEAAERVAANMIRFYQILSGQVDDPVNIPQVFQSMAETYYARKA